MNVNMYMIIGMAPVVGVPLPMFSHGGTSFIIFAVFFGILLNLIAFRNYFLYNSDAKITMMEKEPLKKEDFYQRRRKNAQTANDRKEGL
jgi:rod shape determining protein RodA